MFYESSKLYVNSLHINYALNNDQTKHIFPVSGLRWGMYGVSDRIFMCHLVYISPTCGISQSTLLDGKGKVLINIQQQYVV